VRRHGNSNTSDFLSAQPSTFVLEQSADFSCSWETILLIGAFGALFAAFLVQN
jgi:hypothetical protein